MHNDFQSALNELNAEIDRNWNPTHQKHTRLERLRADLHNYSMIRLDEAPPNQGEYDIYNILHEASEDPDVGEYPTLLERIRIAINTMANGGL